KGFSPAGVDAALPTCFQPAQPYPTDTLWSYELGAKFGLIEERPYLHLTLFRSRWDNGPDLIRNCLVTHIPGNAVSRGLELKTGARLGDLRASVEVTYIDAHYTDTLTDGQGNLLVTSGDALGTPPLVAAPWNVLATLEQRFTVRELEARIRAEDAFHSHNDGPFYTGNPGTPSYAPGLAGDPATNLLNLRATLDVTRAGWVAHAQQLEIALFMNNVLDAQPTLLKRNKGVDTSSLYYATTFRPRTVGLTGTWQF
ncbi:MAG TPA: TonB-dependent receptor, partial [Steroidobacteraceae bacterium]|nr:TonB-dependent receptor [Steroidobacteraceae bacterium]